ncbi:hypothetical protein A1Q2_07750 [Trichosporon asahii var. asahii CBS 8904]|uniref:MARVEL domain-containing protein n=1 Tax=Trichosporon asahii var. asahii (strain CBS 8904) TaxID=1220162 RepID=K1W8H9_TRIAC|nr:hypothetical protein A1Q2_07750 [Trichosporon asahii var. asahii CBS 8904]
MGDAARYVARSSPIVLGIISLFSLIVACITSYLVAKGNGHEGYVNNSYRDRTRFLMFVGWWTFLTSIVYIVAFFVSAMSVVASVLSHLIYISITWVFWLCGAASYAAMMGGGAHCGQPGAPPHCSHYVAAEAFAWINFILLSVCLAILIAMTIAGTRRGDRLTSSFIDAANA